MDDKELLKLAGKLAMECQQVLNSNAKTISDCILRMEKALMEYNNAIFENIK